jgi:hypothetical protein
LICLILWGIGIWQLAFGSVPLGTALVIVGGLSLVWMLAIRNREPGSGLEGTLQVIADFFSTPR